MGNCFSCFKVSPPPATNHQPSVAEFKEDTMELHTLFPQSISHSHHLASIESHANGNRKSSPTRMSTFGGMGSENSGSSPMIQNHNLRLSCGLHSRLTPMGRSAISSSLNANSDAKSHKEPSENKIISLFNLYKDPHDDAILADGIERLCNDLQLSPDEFKVLVLAWKLNAEQMCRFTREEFVEGLKSMKVDSIKGIQSHLPEIVQELVSDGEAFKDLYRFTFRFGLDVSSGQRILPADMAIVLWRLVFTIREPPLLDRWLNFLECHHVRGIPRDTWNMFLNFAESIGDDLGLYNDFEAWPSLFDDFVEYQNDRQNQNITKEDFIKDSSIEND